MVIGHQRILEFLKRSIKNKRLAHAYLFIGPARLGKRRAALEFIRMLNGQEIEQAIHPDILIIEPETIEKNGIKKELEIGIDQAKNIQHQINLSPYRAPYKIVLIDKAEKMTAEASNCLLKILEEPPAQSIFILITAEPQLILPTIVSRCQLVKFLPVRESEIEKGIKDFGHEASPELKRIIRLANGRPELAIQYLENPELLENQNKIINQLEKLLRADLNERYQYIEGIAKDVPQARQILNCWLFWFRDLLLLTIGCPDLVINLQVSKYSDCYSLLKLKNIIQAIKKTDWLLANSSINARLALEVLMLEL